MVVNPLKCATCCEQVVQLVSVAEHIHTNHDVSSKVCRQGGGGVVGRWERQLGGGGVSGVDQAEKSVGFKGGGGSQKGWQWLKGVDIQSASIGKQAMRWGGGRGRC